MSRVPESPTMRNPRWGRCYVFKDDIIVVDPMGEYKDIAAAWGGQYINLTQSAENVFYVNPFHVPDVVPDIDRFVAEKQSLPMRSVSRH